MKICNVHIANNGKYFAIGLVSETKSLFGIFSFERVSGQTKLVKWISKVSHPPKSNMLFS